MQSFFFRIFNLFVLASLTSVVKTAAEADAAPPVEIVGFRNYQPLAKRGVGNNDTVSIEVSAKGGSVSTLAWSFSTFPEAVFSSESAPLTPLPTSEGFDFFTFTPILEPVPLTTSIGSSSSYAYDHVPFPPAPSLYHSDGQSSLTPKTAMTLSSSVSPSPSISIYIGSLFTLNTYPVETTASGSEISLLIPQLLPTASPSEGFLSLIPHTSGAISSYTSAVPISVLSEESSVSTSLSASVPSVPASSVAERPSILSSSSALPTSSGNDFVSSFSSSSYPEATPSSSTPDSSSLPSNTYFISSTLYGENIGSSATSESIIPVATGGFTADSSAPSISLSTVLARSTNEHSSPESLSWAVPTPSNTNSLHDSSTHSVILTGSNFESSTSAAMEINSTKKTEQSDSTPTASYSSSSITIYTGFSETDPYQVVPTVSVSVNTPQSENHNVSSSTHSDIRTSTVLTSVIPTVDSAIATSEDYPTSAAQTTTPANKTEPVYTIDGLQPHTRTFPHSSSSAPLSTSTRLPIHTSDFISSSSAFSSATEESTLSATVTILTPSTGAPSSSSSEKITVQHSHYSPSFTPSVIIISHNSTNFSSAYTSAHPKTTSVRLQSSSVVGSGASSSFNASSVTTPITPVTTQSASDKTTFAGKLSSTTSSASSQFYNSTTTLSSSQAAYNITPSAVASTSLDTRLTLTPTLLLPTDVNTDTSPLPSSPEVTLSETPITTAPLNPDVAQPTADAQSTVWLPTMIFTATELEPTSTESDTSTRTTASSSTWAVPRVISPPTDVPVKDGYTLITIGFKKPLNFAFLFSSQYASPQIFEFLPKILSFPLDVSGVNVVQIVPLESKSRDYLVSVAEVYFPSDRVDDLKKLLDDPTSPLYKSYGETGRQLASLIDPLIPLTGLVGKSLSAPAATSHTNDDSSRTKAAPYNIGGLDDPQGLQKSFAGAVSKRARTVVGVVVGCSCVAAVVIFLIFNYYVKRGKNRILVDDHSVHSSSSGSFDNPLFGRQSYKEEKSLQPVSMLGAGTRASVSPTMKIENWIDYNDNYSRANDTSKPNFVNGRIPAISAPIASENSLGWDA